MGQGADWRRLTLKAAIDIPAIPDGKDFKALHWAPGVSLAAISNDGTAKNAGYAIDSYWLETPWQPGQQALPNIHAAVRDGDGWILRMTYEINLVGNYV